MEGRRSFVWWNLFLDLVDLVFIVVKMSKTKGIIKIFLEDHVVLRQLGLNNTFKTLPVDDQATAEVVQQKMIKALSRFERKKNLFLQFNIHSLLFNFTQLPSFSFFLGV